MADQLTSVRLSADLLERLKILADVNGTSTAAEIRAAVDWYTSRVITSREFPDRVEEANAKRRSVVDELVAKARTPANGSA